MSKLGTQHSSRGMWAVIGLFCAAAFLSSLNQDKKIRALENRVETLETVVIGT